MAPTERVLVDFLPQKGLATSIQLSVSVQTGQPLVYLDKTATDSQRQRKTARDNERQPRP